MADAAQPGSMTQKLRDDPLGTLVDGFGLWADYHIKKETVKAQAVTQTAAQDQNQLLQAPQDVTQRPNAVPVSPNVEIAGLSLNKTALAVAAVALFVAGVLWVAK